MAYTRERITTNGANTAEYIRIVAEKGRLKAATVSPSQDVNSESAGFATISIEIAGVTEHLTIAGLASGPIGRASFTAWTGDIPLAADMEVTARIVSNAIMSVDLAIVTDI